MHLGLWRSSAAQEPGTHACCKRKALHCQGSIEVPHSVLGSRKPHSGLLPSCCAVFQFFESKTLNMLLFRKVNKVGWSGNQTSFLSALFEPWVVVSPF